MLINSIKLYLYLAGSMFVKRKRHNSLPFIFTSYNSI